MKGGKSIDDIEVTVSQSDNSHDIIITSNSIDYLKDISVIWIENEELEGFYHFVTEMIGTDIEINSKGELTIPYHCFYGMNKGKYNVSFVGETYVEMYLPESLLINYAGCNHTEDDLIHLEEQELTCTQDGIEECYYCEKCEGYLYDTEWLNDTYGKDTFITKALGHKYENGKCIVCQEKTGDIETSVEDLPIIDPSKPVEDVVVGTDEKANNVLNETVNDIIENIINGEKVENIDKETVEEIKEQIEAGYDVEIVTEVVIDTLDEDKVDEDHIALIVETVKGEDKDAKVVQYLDLSVLLKVIVDDEEKAVSEVTELSKPMTFTVAIPEELKEVAEGYTRIYFVVRVHNGISETIPVTVNDDDTLSFSTGEFSTYALAYKDVKNSSAPAPEKEPTKTGDNNNVLLLAGLAILSAGTMYVLRRKEEY